MQDIVIVGAGSHGCGIKSILDELNKLKTKKRYNFLGYLDDRYQDINSSYQERPIVNVIGPVDVRLPGNVASIIAINDSKTRAEVSERVVIDPIHPIIHPTAFVGVGCNLKRGVVIQAGVILTCNVDLGWETHVNVGVTISQGTVIGRHTTISPGVHIAGEVKIGHEVQIGTGASIINRISIGNKAIIGAGAVVIRDVPAGATVVGNPGKIIKNSNGIV